MSDKTDQIIKLAEEIAERDSFTAGRLSLFERFDTETEQALRELQPTHSYFSTPDLARKVAAEYNKATAERDAALAEGSRLRSAQAVMSAAWDEAQAAASAALFERDALALELQSVKDALAQVVAENTANVAAQMERDCAAVCENCAMPEQFNHASLDRLDGQYYHAGANYLVWCKATPIRMNAEPANG